MKQIRFNTFETNSSSTHSLVICTEKEFEDLKSGKFYIIDNDMKDLTEVRKYIEKYYSSHLEELEELDELIKLEDFDEINKFLSDYDIETYENWKAYKHDRGLETYSRHFESPSGDKMVAWGHYGYDG